MKARSATHWTWRLKRWCQDWHSPRRSHWFRKLHLDMLWTQLDPYGYGLITYWQGCECIWIWPSKRKLLNPPGRWYVTDLGGGFQSLRDLDKFWEEYSEVCRQAALREEAAREDFYF